MSRRVCVESGTWKLRRRRTKGRAGTVVVSSACASGVAFAPVSVSSVEVGLVKLSERFERAMRAADAVDAAVDAGVTFSPELVWACQRAHGAKLADVVAELGRR